jgi:GR25 family glycosyltransferase involved in LPS biosynthesis
MKISDFFEKGYYVNLDKRPERKECFLNDMAKVGLGSFFERFPAFYHGDNSDFNYLTTHQACGRSLVTVIKKAYDLGYNNVLVFEDDAYFLDNTLEYVESSLDTLSSINDWHMIYLGGMLLDHELNLVGKNLLKQNNLLTTHAIGYSREGMKKVIDGWRWNEGGGAAIDGWFAGEVHYGVPYFTKYVTYPLAVVQYEHRPSDLNGGVSAGLEDYTRGYINKPINKLY